MNLLVSSTDKLLVKFGHEYAEEGDNLIVIPEEEGEINVAWFMYEFVALAIPMNLLAYLSGLFCIYQTFPKLLLFIRATKIRIIILIM